MRKTLILALTAMIAAAAACSVDSDSSGGAGSAGEAGSAGTAGSTNPTSTCQADYARQLKCGQTPSDDEATYIQKCKARIACWSSLMIADYVSTYFPCAAARECGASDDDCADPVFEQQLAIPDVKAAYDDCMAHHGACCDDAGTCSFADDQCALVLVAQSAPRAEMAACLEKSACGDTANCFGTFMAKYAACK